MNNEPSVGSNIKIDRFIRARELVKIVGLSRSTIWRLIRDGKFPKGRQVGPGSVAWLESEILEWMRNRPQAGMAV